MTQKISKNMMGTLGTFTGGIVPSNSTVDTTVQLLINAVNAKEPVIPAGTSGQYLRGDKTLGVLSKTLVGLSNVDNTSDANKPISSATQTALNGKEPSLPSGGNNAHYLRGDKTWATLGKVSVGLSEVDNTSDMNKPVSTAQAAAISALGLTLQPVNTNLTAISALSTTSFGRSFLTQLDAPASRALLGLSTSVTYDVGTLGQRIPLLNGNNSWSGAQTFTSQIVSDSANATSIVLSRNNSSTNIAAEFKTTVGSIFIGNKNGSTFAVKSNNNFSTANWMEVTPTMTSVNGLSTANAQITGGSITGITDLAITDGGTGSSTVFGAKANLGLELVDNTSDINKPISTATQSALDLKASVAAATATVNGLMSFSDKVKLNGIATGATANATDALLRDRSTHTGTQSVDTIVESTAFKIMTAAERTKLSGIEAGATANSTDANLRDRSTHTGSQAISTIANLQSTLDGKESITNRGVANGYAILGSDGKIPSINLPDNGSYKGNWNASTNTPTVVAGTGTNGDTYTVSVAGTQSVTGTSTAFAIGDQLKFTTNGNKWERIPNYQSVSSVAGLTGPISSSDLKTALVLTKTDVGLSNIDNTSDANKPISTAVQTALNGKASTAVATTSVNGLLAFADKVKLDGIAAGATANATDSALRDRATHTGAQAISTVTGLQAALDAKEATLASGTTAQYYRGDKSWQALNAAAVGLGNVDNTADINKPVSTAQQAALNAKQATLVSGTSIKTVGGISLLGGGDVGTLGLEYGGTGSTTAAGARSSLGLGTAATVNTGTSGSVVPMLSSSLTTWSGNKTLSAIGAGVTTRAMVIDVDAGATAAYYFRTGGLDRWRIVKTNSAESGSDVGSDFSILRCADSGTSLGTVFSINRSTGATTISGALSVNSASSGVPVTISGTSGTTSLQRFLSGGSTRWDIGRSGDAETGSNAGSDFVIRRSDDSGNFIDNAFRINRSNARAYFTGILTAPGVFVSSANSTEGGRLTLAKPSTGTLASDVVVDINSDAIRFYEGGGSARGFHLKLDTAMAGAGSNIMDRAYHTGTQAISTVANLQSTLTDLTTKLDEARSNFVVVDYFGIGLAWNDDWSSAFSAAAAAAATRGGIVYAPKRYTLITEPYIPEGVTIKGPWTQPDEMLGAARGDYDSRNGTIFIGNTGGLSDGLNVNGSCAWDGLVIIRRGLDLPFADAAAATTGLSQFSGTAFRVAGPGATFKNLLVLGFDKAIYSDGFERTRCVGVRGDCTNGIDIRTAYDIPEIEDCQFWPYTTVHFSWTTNALLRRSGTAFYGESVNDWMRWTRCFSYGYYRGFHGRNVATVTFFLCGADNTSTGGVGDHNDAIGFVIDGTCVEPRWIACQTAAQRIGYYYANATAQHGTMAYCEAWACSEAGLAHVSGKLTVTGGVLRSSPAAVGIRNESTDGGFINVQGMHFSALAVGIDNFNSTKIMRVNHCTFDSNVNIQIQNAYMPSLTSAETLIPNGMDMSYLLTGNNGITSISSPQRYTGKILTFICVDGLSFFVSGNIVTRSGANTAVAAGRSFSVVSDGTKWYQI